MDNIDNGLTHTVSPHGNNSEHFKDISSPDSETDSVKHRHCVSLPLYYDQVSSIRSISFNFQMFSIECVTPIVFFSIQSTYSHIVHMHFTVQTHSNSFDIIRFTVLQFNWKTFRHNPNCVSLASDSLVLDYF